MSTVDDPMDAPRRQTPARYVARVVDNEEFARTFLIPEGATKSPYSSVVLIVSVEYNGTSIPSKLSVQKMEDSPEILISYDQAKNFSDERVTGVSFAACPGLWEAIRGARQPKLVLPFTEQAQEKVWIPLTQGVAAGIILSFFNGTSDPLDRITSLVSRGREGSRSLTGRILTTYYLCCIKYLTDLDMTSVLIHDSKCDALLDDLLIVGPKYRHAYLGLKSEPREVPKALIAFHAVYGAYVMCRPVATKRSFREWVMKRYSSFLSSIQHTPEANINLPMQAGGTQVNETVIERSIIRSLIYKLTKINTDDIVIAAIKNHVSFLTSLSEMTTYSLINQVIAKGGAVICLLPLSSQIAKYVRERAEVRGILEKEGIPEEDIVYFHLIKPNHQCFKSADYPDIVKTAQIIDRIENPQDKTLDNYRAKTSGSTCDEARIRQFLRAQSLTSGLEIDETHRSQIETLLGQSTEAVYSEARRIIDIIRKKNSNNED